MFKEQMNKIKSLILKNNEETKEEGKNKKKIENLVAFLVILIITLIAINVILKDDKKPIEDHDDQYKKLATDNEPETKSTSNNELEEKIEHILSTISGVRKSKCSYYLFTIIRSSRNVQ